MFLKSSTRRHLLLLNKWSLLYNNKQSVEYNPPRLQNTFHHCNTFGHCTYLRGDFHSLIREEKMINQFKHFNQQSLHRKKINRLSCVLNHSYSTSYSSDFLSRWKLSNYLLCGKSNKEFKYSIEYNFGTFIQKEDEQIPEHYFCPITLKIMKEPVRLVKSDDEDVLEGYMKGKSNIYEKEVLLQRLQKKYPEKNLIDMQSAEINDVISPDTQLQDEIKKYFHQKVKKILDIPHARDCISETDIFVKREALFLPDFYIPKNMLSRFYNIISSIPVAVSESHKNRLLEEFKSIIERDIRLLLFSVDMIQNTFLYNQFMHSEEEMINFFSELLKQQRYDPRELELNTLEEREAKLEGINVSAFKRRIREIKGKQKLYDSLLQRDETAYRRILQEGTMELAERTMTSIYETFVSEKKHSNDHLQNHTSLSFEKIAPNDVFKYISRLCLGNIKHSTSKFLSFKLFEAVSKRNFSEIQKLIYMGVDINGIVDEKSGETIFHKMAEHLDVQMIHFFSQKVDLNGQVISCISKADARYGQTVLHKVFINADEQEDDTQTISIFQLLFESNPDDSFRAFNVKDKIDGNTVFHMMALSGTQGEVITLIDFYLEKMNERKANATYKNEEYIDCLNLANNEGDNLIHVAVRERQSFEMIKLLISVGVDPNKTNKSGETPLHVLASLVDTHQYNKEFMDDPFLDVVSEPLEDGYANDLPSDRPKQPKKEDIALPDYQQNEDDELEDIVELAKTLLENGAAKSLTILKSEQTIIHLLAERGDSRMLEYLIKNHPNEVSKIIDIQEEDTGLTALHFAAWRGRSSIINMLLSAGANPSITDNGGWTPYMTAIREGYVRAILALRKRLLRISE